MEHIDTKNSWDDKLQTDFIWSIGIRSRNWDFFEKKNVSNNNYPLGLVAFAAAAVFAHGLQSAPDGPLAFVFARVIVFAYFVRANFVSVF